MKNNIEKTFDVFISYSRADRMIAEGVCGYLESKKIRCFIDYRDIPKGMNWSNVIPNAIRKSCLMLAIFSKDFNSSEQTDSEISIAANRKLPILVFRITDDDFEGTKEYYLTKSNWIEAFPEPEKFFGELYNNLCILLGIKLQEAVKDNHVCNVSATDKGQEYLQKGLAIQESEDGDREMATYYFRKAAREGNPEGEFRLGMAYYEGLGIPNSWDLAREFFKLSGEHGYAKGKTRLAQMYHYGIGVERNSMIAMKLYTQAAEMLDGKAMKVLGKVLHTGELGIFDEERSRKYYEQAFDVLYEQAFGEDDEEAQTILGNSYVDGEGVEQNYSLGIKMYQRAIKHNYANAFNALGLCYSSGLGVVKDLQKEFRLKLKSAELGYPMGMNNVAINYLLGIGVDKDVQKYKEWCLRAAKCGNISAQRTLAVDYYCGEVEKKSIDKCCKWLNKAIKGGSNQGLALLGILYENGEIVDEEGQKKAVQYYKKAAIYGYVSGYSSLANCYYHGIGTEENDIEAERWYLKMAEVYEKMIESEEDFFREESGAGIVSFIDFDSTQQAVFAEAFKNLAWLYRNGTGVEHSDLLADKWEKVSALLKQDDTSDTSADEAKTLNDLGEDYYYGQNGKEQDYVEAVRYYQKAAKLGYDLAE